VFLANFTGDLILARDRVLRFRAAQIAEGSTVPVRIVNLCMPTRVPDLLREGNGILYDPTINSVLRIECLIACLMAQSTGISMAYASCPKLDVLANRLIEIHRSTDEIGTSSGFTYRTSATYSPIEEIQVAMREHREECVLCRSILQATRVTVIPKIRTA
jgi:hypothetical protein